MRRRWLVSLVAGVGLAVSVGQALSAAAPTARLAVDASFDRRTVLPGQVAVFEVVARNSGPDEARGVVVDLRVVGASLLSARTISGSCTREVGLVRCALSPIAPGSTARIVGVAKPGRGAARVLGSASIVRRVTTDPGDEDDVDTASALVSGKPVSKTYAEVSFVLESPSTVVAGRPFTAVLRLLNRGPAGATIGRVSIVPSPSAPTVVSRAPGSLAAGEERAVIARVTPTRAGALRLNVRVGRSSTHVARIFVREA
jgi:hypothetical protein